MAADTKNRKPIKSTFSPEPFGILGLNFVWNIGGTSVFRIIKVKTKIYSRIRSQ